MEEWDARCRAGVAHELQARGWQLAAPDGEFLAEVIAQLRLVCPTPGEVTERALARATVRCYTRVLFDACGRDGTARQHRAFMELWKHLYPRAVYRLHDAVPAKDALQEALVLILNKRTTCADAGCFLGWCDQVLRRVIAMHFRALYDKRLTERAIEYQRKEVTFAELEEAEMDDDIARPSSAAPAAGTDPMQAALSGPMRDALLAALRGCLDNERWFTVVVELFINDKSFAEVAEQMGTSPLNAQVMKSRALQKLRECPALLELYEDWTN